MSKSKRKESPRRHSPIGSSFREDLERDLQDPEFRKAFEDARAMRRLIEQVVALRKEVGLTQKELAERIGTTQSAISRLENYRDEVPSLDLIRRIAEACGKHLRIEFTDEPPDDSSLSDKSRVAA